MSDYIPLDVKAKIMKNIPYKSLLQFRSVSKAWKSLIDSIEFIADHHQLASQRHNYLLVRDSEHKYVSIVDDDTFPIDKFFLTLPMSAIQHRKPRILGSSHGLFCLYGYVGTPASYSRTQTAAIWNPMIRKLVDIGKLLHVDDMFDVTVGFGVCPHTLDPKIVIVSIPRGLTDTTWQVEVFRLSFGAWTSLSINLPLGAITLGVNQVAIDKFIYWPATHKNVELLEYHVIMSFDLTSEEFTEIHLPDVLALNRAIRLNVYKLKESLAVVPSYLDKCVPHLDVWIMEDGVQKSFKKFNISDIRSVLAFRNSGDPIFLISDVYEPYDYELCEPCEEADQYHLYVYKPNSRQFSSIWISSKESSFFVSSYAETLLLLDH